MRVSRHGYDSVFYSIQLSLRSFDSVQLATHNGSTRDPNSTMVYVTAVSPSHNPALHRLNSSLSVHQFLRWMTVVFHWRSSDGSASGKRTKSTRAATRSGSSSPLRDYGLSSGGVGLKFAILQRSKWSRKVQCCGHSFSMNKRSPVIQGVVLSCKACEWQ